MRRALLLALAAVAALVAALVVRALVLPGPPPPPPPVPGLSVDAEAAAARVAEAVRHATVSHPDPAGIDPAPFLALHASLERLFPRAHAALRREVVGGLSLLYTWPGTAPDRPGLLLLAHQDVVPANPDTLAGWTWPPFSGAVADGYVWGRGSLDDKASLVGALDAVEHLLAAGFEPSCPVVLAFGHDEEVGGRAGARALAARLREAGARFALALDEGLAITEGLVPGVDRPAALVGIAEKGYVSLALTAEAAEGHASMPPPRTAAGLVAAAAARLEADPFPARLEGPVRGMLEALAPDMALPLRVVMANLWLFAPVVEARLAARPATDATQRTTTAVTMLEGSTRENVLPRTARAVVNFRILPGDTVASVVARVQEVVDDPRVAVEATGTLDGDPSPVSDPGGPGFALVARTAREIFPEVAVAPGLVVGGTDARYYQDLADAVLRFVPYRLRPGDPERIHGTDERLAVADHAGIVRFYARLIENACGPEGTAPGR